MLLSTCESQGHQEVEDAMEIQTKLHNGELLKSPATTKADKDDEVDSLGGTTLMLGENSQASVLGIYNMFLFHFKPVSVLIYRSGRVYV